MANTWAVGAAVTLALFAWVAPPPSFVLPPVGPPELPAAAHWLLGVVALATWAYAIAVAAHGTKGALAALLVNALAALAFAVVFVTRVGPGAVQIVLALVALLSAWTLARELAARRGAIQWGATVTYSAATVILAVWQASLSMNVTK